MCGGTYAWYKKACGKPNANRWSLCWLAFGCKLVRVSHRDDGKYYAGLSCSLVGVSAACVCGRGLPTQSHKCAVLQATCSFPELTPLTMSFAAVEGKVVESNLQNVQAARVWVHQIGAV